MTITFTEITKPAPPQKFWLRPFRRTFREPVAIPACCLEALASAESAIIENNDGAFVLTVQPKPSATNPPITVTCELYSTFPQFIGEPNSLSTREAMLLAWYNSPSVTSRTGLIDVAKAMQGGRQFRHEINRG